MRKTALVKLSTIGFLLALSLLFQVACGSTNTPGPPATTPDIQATITAVASGILRAQQLEAELATLPAPTPVPTPDLQAIVARQVEASLAALPTPTPTPTPTPDLQAIVAGQVEA